MKPEKAIELALDATHFGDAEAAKKYGVSERTARRAKTQVARDPVLASVVHAKRKEIADRLHDLRTEALSDGIARMRALMASSEVLRDVAGAYKILADHHEIARGLDESGEQSPTGTGTDSGNQTTQQGHEGGAVVPLIVHAFAPSDSG